MENKRAFFFGCSFTNYHWLTWADISAYDLKQQGYDCYMFAHPGAGNKFIMSSVFAADRYYNFTENDLIMIMWSSIGREDRFINSRYNIEHDHIHIDWVTGGDVHHSLNYGKDFTSKGWWSLENDAITTATSILAVNKGFNVNFQGGLPLMENSLLLPQGKLKQRLERFEMKHEYFLRIEQMNQNKLRWAFAHDAHPSPESAMTYVQNHVKPNIPQIMLTSKTRNLVSEFTEFMISHIPVDAYIPQCTLDPDLSMDYDAFEIVKHSADKKIEKFRSELYQDTSEVWGRGSDSALDMFDHALEYLKKSEE